MTAEPVKLRRKGRHTDTPAIRRTPIASLRFRPETSTLQDVQFLETGIVLRVTPILGHDGRIMMNVAPEISSGRIVDTTGLPEEETTEVETTVVLRDGEAMVVGGLISENDDEFQTKIPIMGNLWSVGRFFQKRSVSRSRTEIIIALVPRVLAHDQLTAAQMQAQYEADRTTIPLLDHQSQPIDRPESDPEFPDAMKNLRRVRLDRISRACKDLSLPRPRPLKYYFPALSGPH